MLLREFPARSSRLRDAFNIRCCAPLCRDRQFRCWHTQRQRRRLALSLSLVFSGERHPRADTAARLMKDVRPEGVFDPVKFPFSTVRAEEKMWGARENRKGENARSIRARLVRQFLLGWRETEEEREYERERERKRKRDRDREIAAASFQPSPF